jgi:sugar phosphate isomerase/epimerase
VAAQVPFQFALLHGFDAFEWFVDKGPAGWAEDDTPAPARAKLAAESARLGMRLSIHALHTADPTTASGASAIAKSIRFGGDVGAAVVNLHLFPQRSPASFVRSLGPLLELARQCRLQLSLENTPEALPQYVNEIFHELAGVPAAAGQIGMCLDSGHANLCPATRNDYVRYVDLLGEHVPIIHWHAHENWGDRDSHLTLFTGPSQKDDRGIRALLGRLLRRKFNGSVILEQWPDPPEELVQARDRLRLLVDSN